MCDHRSTRIRLALRLAGIGGACLFLLARHSPADEPAPGGTTLAAPSIAADRFSLPEGFVIEVVAAPPLVRHPLMGGFDDRGRLYLAESAGLDLKSQELLEKKPNFVRRLEDSNGDGTFDRSTIFADAMVMPQGAVWHRGALYVCSPPHVWRLIDTDDDGVADQRDALVGKFGFIGNAADIHGCFVAPNGRLYWCDGRHGHQFIDAEGNVQSKGQAARIFSCQLDGSDIQAHCGGGMDNPVELDFSLAGDVLGTVNLLFQKRGDCLVHWLHGGAYPRYDQPTYVAEFHRTGDLLGPVIDLGHVAVSGTLRYRGQSLGDEFRDNYFVCEFNTHKLVRVELAREGSTFRATAHEFLTCHDPDFHPTDVVEDADGSLLLIDTGGWFRSGCPTSQIAKPQIAGAIYRIRRQVAPPMADPRGLRIDWQRMAARDLVRLLDDARPAVRERAIDTVATRTSTAADEAIAALADALADRESPMRRANAVWALTRIGTAAAQTAIRAALADTDAIVRQAAASSAAATRDSQASSTLVAMLTSDDDLAVRREAATTLGRLHEAAAVPGLLANLRAGGYDRALEHALIYALIEIADRGQTLPGLNDPLPQVRRAALVALDQMEGGLLSQGLVAPLLDSDDPALVQAALEVISKHPTWSGELTANLRTSLAADLPAEKLAGIRGVLLSFCREKSIQELIAEVVGKREAAAAARVLLLEVIARSGIAPWPTEWVNAVRAALADTDGAVLAQAIVAAGGSSDPTLGADLRALANDASRGHALRVAAAASLAASGQSLDAAQFDLLSGQLNEAIPPIERLAAAEGFSRADLPAAQLAALVEYVRSAGPLELPALIRSFERGTDRELGMRLFGALAKSPGLAALSPARLVEIANSYPTEVQSTAQALAAQQNASRAEQLTQLDGRAKSLAAGDAARGHALFLSTRVGCSGCHRVGSDGAQVGPDLSKIGSIRTRRDLLESILLPNLSLARGYESFTVVTTGGLTYTGLITRQTAEAIWLRTPERAEVRIARDEVAELAPSPQSIMPEGLGRVLTDEQLSDLLAWLEALK
ncbi:MAG: HEAT repeat domain-containing protein [Pirellulales bacterium]|nr:HEAT repeat domain-containing protein [Pirellulales bacterium]